MRRTAQLLGILALGLLLAELVLQVASFAVRRGAARAGPSGGEPAAVRILCVGDSHTHGPNVSPAEAYPAQLQDALAARHPGSRFEVTNLGVPGLNSAALANRLEGQLLRFRPHLVIVWVGVNDVWNTIETDSWSEGRRAWLAQRLQTHSRLFRLASIAWANATATRYDLSEGRIPPGGFGEDFWERREGSGLPPPEELGRGLALDIERMVETARTLETPIVFVTYPAPHYGFDAGGAPGWGVNRVIQETARRLGVAVIDTRRERQRAARDGHRTAALIDTSYGPHPTALLFRYIVDSMLPLVVAQLRDAHGIELGGPAPGSR